MTKNELPTIDPAQLANVTGGTTTDDQLTMMLQQLMTSIQSLAQNQNNGGNNQLMQMLPMFMMLSQRNAQPQYVTTAPAAPVATAPPGWIQIP